MALFIPKLFSFLFFFFSFFVLFFFSSSFPAYIDCVKVLRFASGKIKSDHKKRGGRGAQSLSKSLQGLEPPPPLFRANGTTSHVWGTDIR